ncbi:MAG: PAS domain S-box protein [Planctomycetales bacterium]|nr:PAS domain S-box protein [Planctomycetales bacterium]
MNKRPTFLSGNPLFQLIVEASPAGMLIVDQHGSIVMSNPQILEWFGYTEEDLVGQSIEKLVPEAHRTQHTAHRARYMNHISPRPMAKGRDLFGRCRDGSEFPVDISLHPIITPTEKFILAYVLDATARQKAQHVPKERLAAIGEMVTGLAHESRNSLQRARGCLDLLELDLAEHSDQLDLTRRIRRALEDLERNYEEVRNYAAPIVLDKIDCDLSKLVSETFEELNCEKPDGRCYQLQVNVQPGSEDNYVDRHRMKQVFRNVLENAMAASPPASEILVTIDTVLNDGQKWLRCRICDSGSGISPDIVARVFDPFFTTKQSGTGLGLAISRRIVEAHSGTITAITGQGSGACIQIQLPLIRARYR